METVETVSFFESLSGLDTLFVLSACLGGTVFLVKMVMSFVVGGDADVEVDGDLSGSDDGFRILSLHALSAFAMMFGLAGLALRQDGGFGMGASLAGAVACGTVTLWIVKMIFSRMTRLQSSGTLNLDNAVGAEGEVYLGIAADGSGKVVVTVQERRMVLNAVSEHKEALATGTRVKVVRVLDGSLLSVAK